ncbi:MAG: prenyltransferase/squalene oxidase repeat-containing protein [Planctomycetota bacterium]
MIGALLLACAVQDPAPRPAAAQPPKAAPVVATGDEARTSISKAVGFLLARQNPDGSWGTSTVESLFEINYSNASFYAWKMAGGALCTMALMAAEETPARRDALERSMNWLVENPIPKRGNDWDIDNTWTSLYGFNAMVMAAKDPRFQNETWSKKIKERGIGFYQYLAAVQEPAGGWGYYEGPAISRRPTWSTSFSTACVIPSLLDAKGLGWPIDQKVIDRAVRYVQMCALPSGAYTYDHDPVPRLTGGEGINEIKGSLGRIQICGWARRRAADPKVTDDRIRWGLEQFFKHHRFLDVARLMPVPHESWYANAGYFYYFGHYHAALAINQLPEGEREAWHAQLRRELVKTQWEDGASQDFPGSFYNVTYATSFSILALAAGLPGGERIR